MTNVKIYTNKASITRRLKTAGIMAVTKPNLNNIGVLIELDDRVFAIDRTQKFLEEKAAELSKFGVGKTQLPKIKSIVKEVAAERDYLSRLFQNTSGKSWSSHKNWNTSAALDKWEGVTMKSFFTIIGKVMVLTKRVVGLSLRNHYLHGHYAKGIPGNIPDDIEKLACLKTLELGYNFLTRGLPSTLGNLRNLKTLHLHFNHIMEGLPSLDHLDSLEVLWLNHNHLEGGIDELKKLKKLKGSDGEYTVETRMYDHPFRNVANTDGIFQVGDTLYKIIEDGYVYTSVDKMDCLKQYDGNNYYQNTSDLKIYNFEEESEEMSRVLHPNTCYATELYDENTIGNNRITLRISIIDRDGPINSNTCQFGYRYYAKPYHRSLGWWGCNRTITANVNYVTVGIGGLFYITEEESVPGVSNLVHGGSEFSFEKYSNVYHSIGSGYHITSCSSTASTPDAGTVFVGC